MSTTSQRDGMWLRTYRAVPEPRHRLVCLPHAGGTAAFFHPWTELVPLGVELLAVRYPGRLDRLSEPFIEDMDELADAVADALVPLLDRPISLFGHSMGSSVAYEVALRLETRHGFTPSRVFVSGRLAPHVSQHDDEDFDHSTDDELVVAVRKLGNGDGGAFDIPELREFILPALRADYRLINTYRPTEPVKITAPMVGYAGLSDSGCPIDGMKAWSELTLGGFELRVFPGDHFFLVPEREALLADLGPRLG